MEAGEVNCGAHVVRFEPPDLLVAIFVGDISGDEMNSMVHEIIQRVPGSTWFCLLNLQDLGAFSAEAKKAIRNVPLSRGAAIFGATTQTRIVMSILNKAYTMVFRGADSPIEFFQTETEARAWINRRKLEVYSALKK